jgi:hypothetical protein
MNTKRKPMVEIQMIIYIFLMFLFHTDLQAQNGISKQEISEHIEKWLEDGLSDDDDREEFDYIKTMRMAALRTDNVLQVPDIQDQPRIYYTKQKEESVSLKLLKPNAFYLISKDRSTAEKIQRFYNYFNFKKVQGD